MSNRSIHIDVYIQGNKNGIVVEEMMCVSNSPFQIHCILM